MDKRSKTLQELVKLDYDAIEAYDAAIERLDDPVSKDKLSEFRDDHERHTQNLGELLQRMGAEVPDGPDVKRVLTEGKVKIAKLAGDRAILRAMQANEKVTNEAYDKALDENGLDAAVRDTLQANFDDEKRHKAWIESRIEQL